jgi:transposase-like protein
MTVELTMSSIRPARSEVITSVQLRRSWTHEQKLEIVKQPNEPVSFVSYVARQHGLTAAQLFQWRKAYLEGSLVAVATAAVSGKKIGNLNCRWYWNTGSRPVSHLQLVVNDAFCKKVENK